MIVGASQTGFDAMACSVTAGMDRGAAGIVAGEDLHDVVLSLIRHAGQAGVGLAIRKESSANGA